MIFKIGDSVVNSEGENGIVCDTYHYQNQWKEQRIQVKFTHRFNAQGINFLSWCSGEYFKYDKKTIRNNKLKELGL